MRNVLSKAIEEMVRIGNKVNWVEPIDKEYVNAINELRALRDTFYVDDEELPEWFGLTKEFFNEIRVFDLNMYKEMNGESILNQLRILAQRESTPADGVQRALL